MLSSTLNRASRSPRARRFVERLPVTRRVVDRFVPGEQVEDAVAATASLQREGRLISLDVLGEDISDLGDAKAIVDVYLNLLTALADANCTLGTDLSVKLSALGQTIDDGDAIAAEHAETICAAAHEVGCTMTLDMEDHTTVDSTLAIGEALRASYPSTGNVLQSNLRRTPQDITALANSQTRVRLVKGAYREPASVAHQRKKAVDAAFRLDMSALFASSCYPMIATHDAEMIRHAGELAEQLGRGSDSWELQMLFGVRTDLQAEAVDVGRQLRAYVPFGTDWYGYFMRRLAERPANVAFFIRALRHR